MSLHDRLHGDLRHAEHSVRTRGVENHHRATDETLESTLTDLNKRMTAASESAAQAKAAAIDVATATHANLAAQLVREKGGELERTASTFGDSPREATRKVIDAWLTFHARAVRELGAPPHPMHLAIPFAGYKDDRIGSTVFSNASLAATPLEAASRAIASILRPDPMKRIAEIQDLLTRVEIAVQATLARHDLTPDRSRANFWRTRCTDRDLTAGFGSLHASNTPASNADAADADAAAEKRARELGWYKDSDRVRPDPTFTRHGAAADVDEDDAE